MKRILASLFFLSSIAWAGCIDDGTLAAYVPRTSRDELNETLVAFNGLTPQMNAAIRLGLLAQVFAGEGKMMNYALHSDPTWEEAKKAYDVAVEYHNRYKIDPGPRFTVDRVKGLLLSERYETADTILEGLRVLDPTLTEDGLAAYVEKGPHALALQRLGKRIALRLAEREFLSRAAAYTAAVAKWARNKENDQLTRAKLDATIELHGYLRVITAEEIAHEFPQMEEEERQRFARKLVGNL